MLCAQIRLILTVSTPAGLAPVGAFRAAIRAQGANSMDLADQLATSRAPQLAALAGEAGPDLGAVAVAAAAAVEAALPEAALVGVEALRAAVDEVAAEAVVDLGAGGAAVRMRRLSVIVPGGQPTRSGPRYFSPRETRSWTRGRSRSMARFKIRARMLTIATA